MLDWGLGFLDGLASFVTDPAGAVAGWTFDKVTVGIYEWLARGLAVLIEWVWRVLDRGTTPRLSDDWFADGVFARLAALALAVVVAMMLATAIQAALGGRPELALGGVKEGARAVVASAFVVAVVDLMVGVVDEASAAVWQVGRDDLVMMLEAMVGLTVATGFLGQTFIGPLCLMFGFVGLLGVAVSLLMRSALVYLVAALAPLVWSASVLPMMRDASRRLVHILVALVVAKLAIVVSLVVAVQLAASAGAVPGPSGEVDVAEAAGALVTGFACFLVAAVSPAVLYRLMPTVEGAVASSGVVGGWGRSAMSVAQAGLMAYSAGAGAAGVAVAGEAGVAGAGEGAAALGGASGSGGAAGGGASATAGAGGGGSVATGGSTSAGAGGVATGSGDAGDGNLPRLPDPEPDSGPAPWVPPGAASEDTGPSCPLYGPYTVAGSDDGGGPGGGLPPLPASPPAASPWALPGSSAEDAPGASGGESPS